MFLLYADKNKLTVRQREPLTSGSVNVNAVKFEFSPDWEGLERTAVFRAADGEPVSVLLAAGDQCGIPWEVLSSHGQRISAGVCGTRGAELVLPTVWADLGAVQEGACPGEPSRPPTPELWEQALEKKGDALGYTEAGELGLYAGEKLLSSVPVSADHRTPAERDAADQHPIGAITGLEGRLEKTITTDSVLSVAEILKIMEVS